MKWRVGLGETGYRAVGPMLSAAGDSLFGYLTGGAIGESSPVIGPGSTVYVGSYDHFLYAIAPDGTLQWKFETEGKIFSSAAVAGDGTIIFGSGDNFVYAVASDGSLRWKYETGGPIFSSVALALDGTVYVAPWDEYLYALNPDGSLKWKLKLGDEPGSYTVRAGPAVDSEGVVYLGADRLYAVDPQGTLKWSFGAQGNRPTNPAAIGGDGTIYFPTLEALFAVKAEGSLKWSYPAGGMSSVALDNEGNVYFGSADSLLYALDSTGTLKWTYAAGGGMHSSVAIGSDSTIYFGSLDSTFYAVSTDSTLKWEFKTGGDINTPPTIGPDGTVYVGSLDGYLYAFDTGTDRGVMDSPWPEFGRDSRNSFRAVGEPSVGDFKFYFETGNTVSSSPAFAQDGTVYFGSWDSCFYAVSPDGFLKWKFQAAGAISASPVVGADSAIYFGSWGHAFYGLNPDGTLKWQLYMPEDVRCTPALAPDGTLYFGHYGKLRAISSAGRIKWTFKAAYELNPPAIGEDGTIYFISETERYLYAVYPNGALNWKFQFENAAAGGPSIGPDGTVYLSAGDLFAVNPDGTLKWNYQATDSMAANSFTHTPIVGADSTVYVSSLDRHLYAVGPDGTLKWKTELAAEAAMPPVIGADGTIYLASKGDSVFALAADSTLKWTKYVGQSLDHQYPGTPALGPDGTLYLGTRDNALIGIETGTGEGPATEGWPRVGRDLRNTGSLAEPYTPPVKNCDFSGDGLIAIGDAIFFLLLAREQPGDPRLDWNGDGVYEISDAIALLRDIADGNCPDAAVQLAAVGSGEEVERVEGLSASDIEYLEEVFSNMPLTPEELSALRLALYGDPPDAPSLPRAFSLAQNFPNPFNPATTITYQIPIGSSVWVTLIIFNTRGALVHTLVDSERSPGTHTVFWDGTDNSGRRVPSGVYFYRIEAGSFSKTRKMVLLK